VWVDEGKDRDCGGTFESQMTRKEAKDTKGGLVFRGFRPFRGFRVSESSADEELYQQ